MHLDDFRCNNFSATPGMAAEVGNDGTARSNAHASHQQVSYHHPLVSYMMMPVEAVVPLDGGFTGRSPYQPMGQAAMAAGSWGDEAEEVYSD